MYRTTRDLVSSSSTDDTLSVLAESESDVLRGRGSSFPVAPPTREREISAPGHKSRASGNVRCDEKCPCGVSPRGATRLYRDNHTTVDTPMLMQAARCRPFGPRASQHMPRRRFKLRIRRRSRWAATSDAARRAPSAAATPWAAPRRRPTPLDRRSRPRRRAGDAAARRSREWYGDFGMIKWG